MTPKATATAATEAVGGFADGELLQLLRRAEQGDREVLPRLRALLDRAREVCPGRTRTMRRMTGS
jgi:hypothetical protein